MTALSLVVTFIGELTILLSVITPIIKRVSKIAEGQKCQLRNEMLRIYYNNVDKKTIKQYEFENFVHLYEAYKSLGGNSFIDKIYEEVQSWEIIK